MIERKHSLFLLLIAVVSFTLCCREKNPLRGVELEVGFSESPLTDRLFTDVRYTWRTQKAFKGMEEDATAFVHFWHRSNLILHDNHRPETPTSQWEVGNEYAYSRRIYIPPFIDAMDPEFGGAETLRLSIGFAIRREDGRTELRKVVEKKVKVFPPPPDTPEIVYGNGWYDHEVDPETHLKRWRWTSREARCIIGNPGRDAQLVIRGGVNKEVFKDQRVIFRIDGWLLDELVPPGAQFERSYRIKKEMLGEGDRWSLVITTDKTFVPAAVIAGSQDGRELGVQVSFIYFR